MKAVFKTIWKILHKFWDINLSIILFILYMTVFLPYKFFSYFSKKEKNKWWEKVDKYNFNNKSLPY